MMSELLTLLVTARIYPEVLIAVSVCLIARVLDFGISFYHLRHGAMDVLEADLIMT